MLNFEKTVSIIGLIIALIALVVAWFIPYNIHKNEQKFNLQGLDNLLNYSIISNIVSGTGSNNAYIEIEKSDLIDTLDKSIDKMTNISKKVFNDSCDNKSNLGVLKKLGDINNNYYDSVFTYFTNLKREIVKNNQEKISFSICNDELVNNNIDYYNYYPCLSRLIGNCNK